MSDEQRCGWRILGYGVDVQCDRRDGHDAVASELVRWHRWENETRILLWRDSDPAAGYVM